MHSQLVVKQDPKWIEPAFNLVEYAQLVLSEVFDNDVLHPIINSRSCLFLRLRFWLGQNGW